MKFCGYNTDSQAACDSLKSVLGELKNKTILLLGAGGVARAIAFGLERRGVNLLIINRDVKKAEKLAYEIGGRVISFDDLSKYKLDAIINATSVGMKSSINDSPIESQYIPENIVAFDTIYNPVETKFLKLAYQKNYICLNGFDMFLRQGVRQFEYLTNRTFGDNNFIKLKSEFRNFAPESINTSITIDKCDNKNMRKVFDYLGKDIISSPIRLYGLIGNPTDHSLSPALYYKMFKMMDMTGEYVAFNVLCNPNEFIKAVCSEFNFRGFSITAPFKEVIVNSCNWTENKAEMIGSYNTLASIN